LQHGRIVDGRGRCARRACGRLLRGAWVRASGRLAPTGAADARCGRERYTKTLSSASRSAPGKRRGKQTGPRFSIRGSPASSKMSLLGAAWRFPFQPVAHAQSRAIGLPSMPKAAERPLVFGFCCFPPASRLSCVGRGNKNRPEGPFYASDFAKKIWSWRRNSNPRPQSWKGCAPGGKGRSRQESTLNSPATRHNSSSNGEYLMSFEFNYVCCEDIIH
jgi:hypothetical protein